MTSSESIAYVEAKARVLRATSRLSVFIKSSVEYNLDRSHAGKAAKIETMLRELRSIREAVEIDIQLMETSVFKGYAPPGISDSNESQNLITSFDSLYYELAAFADVHKFSLSSQVDPTASTSVLNKSFVNNSISGFQLPKRKFPSFSGVATEWQGFEDLFKSILSHIPDLPEVERFEYLRTSLAGEALSLISHLPITTANYTSAWEILRARYGNKRDLAKIHLDALLTPHIVKSADAESIQKLINVVVEHTAALDNLDFVTRQWSPILVHIFEKYLDYDLRVRWELSVGDKCNPSINDFVAFLRQHLRSASVYSSSSQSLATYQPQKLIKSTYAKHVPRVLTTGVTVDPCLICQQVHVIRLCPIFLKKTPSERFNLAKEHRLCLNCLHTRHGAATCLSKYSCRTCNQRHHSLLHFNQQPKNGDGPHPVGSLVISQLPLSDNQGSSVTTCLVSGQTRPTVLLSTLKVVVLSVGGTQFTLRALMDSGSEASFITAKCADQIALPRRKCSSQVRPFAGSPINIVSGMMTLRLAPCSQPLPIVTVDALIVPNILDRTPQTSFLSSTWSHIQHLPLADPTYNVPGPVDILLGADIVPSILTGSRIAGQPSEPIAFDTSFGWVLMGPVNCTVPKTSITSFLIQTENLDHTLTRFWEMEEPPQKPHLSVDDSKAEQLFLQSISRLASGRFSIALPFKTLQPILGDSKSRAFQRYKNLEWKLSKDSKLRDQYTEFMRDYLDSGHMEFVPFDQRSSPTSYYIPHHCVLRPDSQTTKLRVVFDASAKTTAGMSLNECLFTGPKLQADLQHILIRARLHAILFTADIKQMYRQIRINENDRDYLRILWRFDSSKPVDEYRLCTVTYGTSSAPYQAIKTLQHLATLEQEKYPIASQVLLTDTFVDDVLTGASTLDAALFKQKQLIQLCSSGQFVLRKWASNSSQLLNAVPEDTRSIDVSVLFDDEAETGLKVLGMRWNPRHDQFSFSIRCLEIKPTKRTVLSEIARIFDPLGVLSPVTFLTKYLMQLLWTAGIGWDDMIPDNAVEIWERYRQELPVLADLRIPRRITYDNCSLTELHAFSDSSKKGYAAAVYLRSVTASGITCHLITAKSKIAPLKVVTIPRLELCGALLAAKLLKTVRDVVSPVIDIDNIHAWTDSMTTIAWIKSSPHRWNTFVANRVSQLQELTAPSIWQYVPTDVNPVDCASRGLFPSELLSHPLWWTGPDFLKNDESMWPVTSSANKHCSFNSEVRPAVALVTTTPRVLLDNLLQRISSLNKIIRIVAYCLRMKRHTNRTCIISPVEYDHALTVIIKEVQMSQFHEEIHLLVSQKPCSNRFRKLNPFLDSLGILRVGGRLSHASIPYEQKHPALIPSNHRFTTLLVQHFHQLNHHPGAIGLQVIIQQQFWIISARQVIRDQLRRCLSCYRTRPRHVQPKMGNLPACRLQQVKPFNTVGVDYAGPITLKCTRTRQMNVVYAYICLFVCMSTKALHIELATDLSTETFLMAFTRFAARRGPIQAVHSDCGTNFVGASRLFETAVEYQNQLSNHLSKLNITWHFNPPSSPHFGGLWEAGVKSVKGLLYKSLGTHRLTYEELSTYLVRIEATLNSRPLSAMSDDPSDFNVLTPNHFLTLEPSTSIPDPNLTKLALSKMQRWRLIDNIHRYFWGRWNSEYLHTLQQRSKWITEGRNLQLDSLVLIKEPTWPLLWKRGRIVELHPGNDGIARVATVKTANGLFKRPAVKLCPLPMY